MLQLRLNVLSMIQIELHIALIKYEDNLRNYILCPGLKVGDKIISGNNIDIKTGNCLKLKTFDLELRYTMLN